MFDSAGTPVVQPSAGCWRHASIVGERACDRCGVQCCEHCWLEAPHGDLCIDCALVFCGVRARRRRSRAGQAGMEVAPLATLSWDASADLIDLRRAA